MHVTLIQLQNDLVVAKPVQDTTRNEDFDELEHSSSLVFTPEFANVVNVDGLRIKDSKVFVIWKWQVLHPQDKTVIIVRGNCCLFSANGTPDYSDAESETVTHHTFQGDRMY